MLVRQSLLKTWMQCPLQARFKMVEHLPSRQNAKASFGTIIHYCLEQFNQGLPIEETVQLFKELWAEPEKLGVTPDYWPKNTTYGGLREKGVEILRQYEAKTRWENRTIIASEHKFRVPFGRHEIAGIVDHLELKKAGNGKLTLRVVDFKTNARSPLTMQLFLDVQFTAYIYASLQPEFWIGSAEYPGIPNGEAWFNKLQGIPRRGVWYQLMANKELDAGARGDGDFMRLYRACEEIERALEANVFVPNISGETCVLCDYTQNCGIDIPGRDEDEELA